MGRQSSGVCSFQEVIEDWNLCFSLFCEKMLHVDLVNVVSINVFSNFVD
jgi:hypothetical protein